MAYWIVPAVFATAEFTAQIARANPTLENIYEALWWSLLVDKLQEDRRG